MNLFSDFNDDARQALQLATELARKLKASYVGTEHLLLGLVAGGGDAADILAAYEVTLEKIISVIPRNSEGKLIVQSLGYSPRMRELLKFAVDIASMRGDRLVTSVDLLFSLLTYGSKDNTAVRVINKISSNPKELEERVIAAQKSLTDRNERNKKASAKGTAGKKKASATPELDKYGRDLTLAAEKGELDPVIGRESEIERLTQILIRRTKNNPVLVGEPGVGKSAIAEGIAQRIAEGTIPEVLRSKRVVSLDLAGMIAGTKYRGEFEQRFKDALAELTEAGNVILFIDEIHTIVGAGASEGSMDAANMLKPMLARGQLQLIGATTLDEYRKYIEKDAALERRFAPVSVGEPTKSEAVEILLGLRDRYEAHHKLHITDEALKAAVTLSDRYISDRFLPDKAIDLMDEACSKVRIELMQSSKDVNLLKDRLERLTESKQEAVDSQDFETAAELRDKIASLKTEIESAEKELESERRENAFDVTEEDIAAIVSEWTHIPVCKLTEGESKRLLNLENILHERVIGQDEAVKAVSKAIRRARAGLKDPKRPIGSFIFSGPTGVGKTELAKALAEAIFGDENAIIRIDMSEYMEKHTVSKLVGSPPGYVGFDEGGQLTEKVRRMPYSVLLFDEVEKAHPDVFNILLQILDDGRLTDSKGRTVDFKNCVLIMTSNLGAQELEKNRIGFGASRDDAFAYEVMKEHITEELKQSFRPEFLNRIDDIIVFHRLDEEDTRKISRLMLNSLVKRLAERGINLTYTDESAISLASDGFDREYGARPLRRLIQQTVEDMLSEDILDGKITASDDVEMFVDDDGKLAFRQKTEEPAMV